MQKQIIITILLAILILGGLFAIKNFVAPRQSEMSLISSSSLKLVSDNFKNGEYLPPKFTCDGTNVNPSLEISNVPAEAKSLVLIMEDLDAPVGSFTHWLMWNIDPQVKVISEDSLSEGAREGINDFGKNKYSGPCPPSADGKGIYHYVFKLYAIDFKADSLSLNTGKEKILKLITGHILAKTELVGLYQR